MGLTVFLCMFCTTGRSSRFCLRRLKKGCLSLNNMETVANLQGRPSASSEPHEIQKRIMHWGEFWLIFVQWISRKVTLIGIVIAFLSKNLYHQIIIKSRKERILEFVKPHLVFNKIKTFAEQKLVKIHLCVSVWSIYDYNSVEGIQST